MFNLTPIVKNLLIVNVLMFAVPALILQDHNLFVNLFGLKYLFASSFLPTQLLTYSLIHASWSHLFSNMLGLLVFGPILEMRLGPKRFVIFYFATAVGAGIIYSLIHLAEVYPFIQAANEFLASPNPDLFARVLAESPGLLSERTLAFVQDYGRNPANPLYIQEASGAVRDLISFRENSPMVGASGAVYGVMLGFGYLFPNLRMMLLFPPIPVQAKYLIAFYAVAALYYAVEKVPGDNVAHYAHLGGMLVGWIILRIWKMQAQRF